METIHENYQYLFQKIRSNLQQKIFKTIVKLRCLLHDPFDEKFEWLFCFIFLVHIALELYSCLEIWRNQCESNLKCILNMAANKTTKTLIQVNNFF